MPLAAALAVSALACLVTGTAVAGERTEKRCGYLSNPTPANWWLTDRDGECTIGVQGGYQAEGLDVLPQDFYKQGWVRTNGYYGYRCACLTVTTDREDMRITQIFSGEPLSMKRCKADKALKRDP